MTAVFAVAFFVTLALFGVALIGGQQQRDDLRRRLRGAEAARRVVEAALRAEVRDHATTRRAWADERAGATLLRPIAASAAARRIAAQVAANEAERFDPDHADWSGGAS